MRQADRPIAAEIIELLLEGAKTETMRRHYERITPGPDGAIRSFMSPTTETGRSRHAESFLEISTNLANLPKKTALLDPLYRVRDCIVPHPGRLLGKADYSQAEARWCAYIAGDEARISMYEQGIDQYRYFVAVLKWEDPSRIDEVTKKERDSVGKVGILSGQYRATWKTHLDKVNKDYDIHGVTIDAKTAKRMEGLYPELFPQTVEWWQRVRNQVLTYGYIEIPGGLKRYFFGRTDSESARDAVVREAIACGPQGANAWMLNCAFRALFERHDPRDLRLLLTAHDEIVFDCSPRDGLRVAKLVKDAMEFPVQVGGRTLVVPAEVSLSSRSWAETRRVA